jgi:hypothetical protein
MVKKVSVVGLLLKTVFKELANGAGQALRH